MKRKFEKLRDSSSFKIFMCIVVLVTSIGFAFYQSRKDAYGYGTTNGVTKSQKEGYLSVDIANAWLSIVITNSQENVGLPYTVYNDKPHTVNVAISNSYLPSGYDIKIKNATSTTYKENTKNYTLLDITLSYKLPAHYNIASGWDKEAPDKINNGDDIPFYSKSVTQNVGAGHVVSGEIVITTSVYAVGLSAAGTKYYGSKMIYKTEKKTYGISIDPNGGVLKDNGWYRVTNNKGVSAAMPCGTNVTILGDPVATRKNYYLSGWSKTGLKGNLLCQSNATYTAAWTQKKLLVQVQPNGAKGSVTGQIIMFGNTETLKKNSYVRDGYKFMGWSLTENGSVDFEDGQTLDVSDDTIKDILKNQDADINKASIGLNLHAVWQKEDANFDMTNILIDDSMFINDRLLKGHYINGSSDISYGYDKEHIDSEYARPATKDRPGYFTNE